MTAATPCAPVLLLALLACGASPDRQPTPEPPRATAAPPATAPPQTCASAPGWRYERIELPPEFAPSLAKGVEHLYFAPGMFEPDSPTYFTYVFSLAFEAARTWDEPGMQAMLEAYYRGLMTAVAESKQRTVGPDAIRATVSATAHGFIATVDVVDAFTTHESIKLYMRLDVDGACVRAAVAPVEPGAAVWTQLDEAIACVACPPY